MWAHRPNLLDLTVTSPTRAYLDYNAGAPLRPAARAALLNALDDAGANPSSPHRSGQQARLAVESARREVALLVGASPREVIFAASGTEALNLAIRGSLSATAHARDHIVVSAIEHAAVGAVAEALAAEGTRVTTVAVDRDGRLDLAQLAAAVNPRTALVVVMLASNELGTLQPIVEVRAIARGAGALVVTDAVQAAGRIPLDLRALGVDYLAISAHKLGGPQGAGALIVRHGAPIAPIVFGGGQESGLRGGTENVPAIAGFGAAARAARLGLDEESARVGGLRALLEAGLRTRFPSCRINAAAAPRLPGTTSVTLPGYDAEGLVVRLDLADVAASTGAACASGAAEPSHVLRAIGLSPADARATLRLSLGWASTEGDVVRTIAALGDAVDRQRTTGVFADHLETAS